MSCLLLNTEKGMDCYDKIKQKLDGLNALPIDFAVKNNGCLGSATLKPKNRDSFSMIGRTKVTMRWLIST